MSGISISLCMITKNEEKFLEQCLESVKELVDEIIIVDTGSTDRTKEIARNFTDKVIDFKWNDDFSAARNESLKHATKDWILILDADEVISRQDHQKIKEAIEADDTIAYRLILRNYINETKAAGWKSSKDDSYEESKKANGWWEVTKIRLFRNVPSISYNGRIHETVYEAAKKQGGLLPLSVPIHHYGKLDPGRLKERSLLYEKLGEKKVEAKKDYYAHFELGRQYAANQKFDEAIKAFEKSIELNKDYFESHYMLGSIYLIKENLDLALSSLEKARSLNQNFGSTHANMGIVYAKKQEYPKAIESFQKAINLNPKNASAYKNLGMCFHEMGDEKKAHDAFKKAIELNPAYKDQIKLR